MLGILAGMLVAAPPALGQGHVCADGASCQQALNGLERTFSSSTGGGPALLASYRKLREDVRSLHLTALEALASFRVGQLEYSVRDYKTAVRDYDLAGEGYKDLGDRGGQANALNNSGWALYLDNGDSQRVAERLREAIGLRRALGDRRGLAESLYNLGLALERLGELEKEEQALEEAAGLSKELGNAKERAGILSQWAIVARLRGENDRAESLFDEAKELAHAGADLYTETKALLGLGSLQADRGEATKALATFQSARSAFHDINRIGEATAITKIAELEQQLHDRDRALGHLEEARRIFHEEGSSFEATVLSDIGSVYIDLDRDAEALVALDEALRKQSGSPRDTAYTLMRRAAAYRSQGQSELAKRDYEQALAIFQRLGESAAVAGAEVRLSRIHLDAGELGAGLSLLDDAREIWDAAKNKSGAASALMARGHVDDEQGWSDEALTEFNSALQVFVELQDKSGQANALDAIGVARFRRHELATARKELTSALTLRRAVRDPGAEAETLGLLGRVEEEQGDIDAALVSYEQAADLLDKVRGSSRADELALVWRQPQSRVYERAAVLRLRRGEDERAFLLTERARARSFLDRVGNLRPVARPTLEPALAEALQETRTRLTEAERRADERLHPGENAAELVVRQKELGDAQLEFQRTLAAVRSSDPQSADLEQVQPLGSSDLRQRLDRSWTVVSYFLTGDTALVFVFSKRRALVGFELPTKSADIIADVGRFRRQFSWIGGDWPEPKTLYKALIDPLVNRHLLSTRHLIIVPHRELNYLPFACLESGAKVLLDDHTLSYLPSASALEFIGGAHGGRPAIGQVVAFGYGKAPNHPSLDTKPVLNVLEREMHAAVRSGSAASETALRQVAATSDLLFVHAHGVFDEQMPLSSGLFLAPDARNDGKLQVYEIYDLDLRRVEMVVLSGCETGLGQVGDGDDLVGLSRAFMYAGAKTLVASLWLVREDSTARLMEEFAHELKLHKASRAEALRTAQLKVREEYPHLYHWAGFGLTGDPGRL